MSLSRSSVSLASVLTATTFDTAAVLVVVLALREGSLRTTIDDRATRRPTVQLLHAPSPVVSGRRRRRRRRRQRRRRRRRRRRTNRCRDRRRQSVVSTTSSVGIDVDVVSVRLESYIGAVESDNRSVDNAIGRRPRPLRFYVFVRRFDPRLSSPR